MIGIETLDSPTELQPPPRPPALAAEQPVVFERLHALVRKGYVAAIGTDRATDVIVLRHLGKAPDLVLRSNGVVEGFAGRRPLHKRHVEPPAPIAPGGDAEQLRFMKFLEGVPAASLRDRTRPWRHKYVYFPAVMIVLWGLCMTLTVLILEG